jgi:hypothetical protein
MKINFDNKIKNILNTDDNEMLESGSTENVTFINTFDGLFESKQVINKKIVTSDGRQLLKEIKYEA